MSKEMLKLALTTKEASILASLRGVLKRALGLAPGLERAAINASTRQGVTPQALKGAVGTSVKKNLGSATAGSLRRAAGAGLGSGIALPTLEALGVENQPLLWGLVGSAGVLGHDLAGGLSRGGAKHLKKISCARRDKEILLQKLAKTCSSGRKKKADMIKEGPYKKEYSLTNTKEANLSRAAKGAIAAPLGVMGAAAIHPELFGHNAGEILSHTDSIGSRVLGSLDNISRSAVGDLGLKGTGNILASLGGLSALGAGAGKLSEKVVPVAKNKSISKLLEDPKNRKILAAVGLFPWISTAAGITYLVNKAKGSDS